MKKHGAKQIPDFSSHRQPARGAAPSPSTVPMKGASPPARPPRAPTVKPQSTSSKSGRRGQ